MAVVPQEALGGVSCGYDRAAGLGPCPQDTDPQGQLGYVHSEATV